MRVFFKDIAGYEGLYQVSNFGEVRSLGRWRCNSKGTYFQEGRILKLLKDRGYMKVNFYKNGKMKQHSVHRLVAQAFIPNPDNLPEVNHKDENPGNNVVCVNLDGSIDFEKSNLEWCDHAYNMTYGTLQERQANARRGVYNNPKLSKKVLQLTLDGKIVREWASTKECSRNGFNQGHVAECCRGERKTHKGYRWVYAEDYGKELAA